MNAVNSIIASFLYDRANLKSELKIVLKNNAIKYSYFYPTYLLIEYANDLLFTNNKVNELIYLLLKNLFNALSTSEKLFYYAILLESKLLEDSVNAEEIEQISSDIEEQIAVRITNYNTDYMQQSNTL